MDDRLRLFLTVVAGFASFGLLGAAFGGLTGAVLRARGRAAGGLVGLALARAFARVRGRPLSSMAEGVLIGGADGACFLGVAGAAAGGLFGPERLAAALGATALLMIGAVIFGGVAYWLQG